ASCPKTYPLGRPHWLPAFSTISASPCEIVPKNRCPASMTSFEEYCPLCEGGLLAGGGPLAGGGYACARADSVPQGTRARTRRVVRIIVCIACSIRGGMLAVAEVRTRVLQVRRSNSKLNARRRT